MILRLVGIVLALCLGAGLAAPAAMADGTVVIRVVGTTTSWGQEGVPAWPSAAPVKVAGKYKLYDLQLGRDAAGQASFARLFHFVGYPKQHGPALYDEQSWKAFATKSRMANFEFPAGTPNASRSAMLTDQIILMAGSIISYDKPDRLVLAYAGHGSHDIFFEGMVSIPDSIRMVKGFRQMLGKEKMLVLDFSTNCNDGFWDFARNYKDSADYLIASDLTVGGYSGGSMEALEGYGHDQVTNRFWADDRFIEAALDDIIASRRGMWQAARANIVASRVPQALSVYDLRKLDPLMATLGRLGVNQTILQKGDFDLGNYVQAVAKPELSAAFDAFRVRYDSNKDMFAWGKPTEGFGIFHIAEFVDATRAAAMRPSAPSGLRAQ